MNRLLLGTICCFVFASAHAAQAPACSDGTAETSEYRSVPAKAASEDYIENVMYTTDFSTMSSYDFWKGGTGTFSIADGCLLVQNATAVENYIVQYMVAANMGLEVGSTYIVRTTLKGSAEGQLYCGLGNWSGKSEGWIPFTTEMKTVNIELSNIPSSDFILFQSGAFKGDIYISKVEVIKRVPAGSQQNIYRYQNDFEDGSYFVGWGGGNISIADGGHNSDKCWKFTNATKKTNSYEIQACINVSDILYGQRCTLHFWAKAENLATESATTVGIGFQKSSGYAGRGDFQNLALTTEWKEYTASVVVTGEGTDRLLFNLGHIVGTVYIDDIELYYVAENQKIIVGEAGYATYTSLSPLDFSKVSEIAAYKASVSGSTITLTKVTKAAAGEGLLIRSLKEGTDKSVTAVVPFTDNYAKASDNKLIGVTGAAKTVNKTEDTYTNYVLSKEAGVVGFYLAKETGTNVAAGKAYLQITTPTSSEAKALTMVFDDEANAISEVKATKRPADDACYTLSGVRVTNPTKGLYIKNGKKIIIK